jgi:hypothetical protein
MKYAFACVILLFVAGLGQAQYWYTASPWANAYAQPYYYNLPYPYNGQLYYPYNPYNSLYLGRVPPYYYYYGGAAQYQFLYRYQYHNNLWLQQRQLYGVPPYLR